MKFNILSMNANGPTPKGSAEKRITGIARVLEDHTPLLMFVQEFPWKTLPSGSFEGYQLPGDYKFEGEEEAQKYNGFIFNHKKVIYTNLNDKSSTVRFEHSRLFIALFKVKGPNCMYKVICASWHGPHTSQRETEKLNQLKSMLEFLLQLKKDKNCPLIIGGGFNLNAEEVKEHLNGDFKLRTPSESSIDMILFTPDVEDIFNISDVEALPMYKAYTFDHAPLKIEVTTEENDGERAEAGGGRR